MTTRYPVRPEREAHGLIGVSSGGWAAYTLAIRHRPRFGVVIGLLPLLNPRWVDCHGKYRGDFDPCCWGWRDRLDKDEVLALFYGFVVRLRWTVEQFFGWGPSAVARISHENPTEMLDRCDVRPGELAMYVAYVGRDQLNCDALTESFLYVARRRGLCVRVDYCAAMRHTVTNALTFVPRALDWLARQLPPDPCPAPPGDAPPAGPAP